MLGRCAGPCGRLRRRFATCPPKRVALLRRISRLEAGLLHGLAFVSHGATETRSAWNMKLFPAAKRPPEALRGSPRLRVRPRQGE